MVALVIGSRESELALIQTNHVLESLQKNNGIKEISILKMKTKGDKILDIPLSNIGEKALFTKELEVALLSNKCHLIVHSLKDLPTTLPDNCYISAIMERKFPDDVLVVKKGLSFTTLEQLPEKSIIGTSSRRRIAQLQASFPHLIFQDIRGNLNTRLAKLDANTSPFTAIILAQAGLTRLNQSHRITQNLGHIVYPAVGQGALAVESKINDPETTQIVQSLIHYETFYECSAERSFLKYLEGGCSIPIGVVSKLTRTENTWKLQLKGRVSSLDGKRQVEDYVEQIFSSDAVFIKKPSEKWQGLLPEEQALFQSMIKQCEYLGVELGIKLEKLGVREILAGISS